MYKQLFIALSLICLPMNLFFPVLALCQEDAADEPLTFTFYWENDALSGADRDYSNGLKMTWSSPYTENREKNGGLRPWLMKRLPYFKETDADRALSFSVGHVVYTPEDNDKSELIEDDRPYAGYAYLGFGFHSQTNDRSHTWQFDVGVVGPLSRAQELQDFYHELVDVRKSQGWSNQLNNELGLEVTHETKWRVWQTFLGGGLSADLITHAGSGIGNIAIQANTGAEFRLGWNVPDNFGTCPIRPGCAAGVSLNQDIYRSKKSRFDIHFFAAVEGRLVLHDIFLDGNTFQQSHSVEKEPFVGDLMGGVAFDYGRFRFSYAQIFRSREFKERDRNQSFGAASFSFVF